MIHARSLLIWFCACIAVALLVGALTIGVLGLDDTMTSADVVVVPGNTVNSDGSLSQRLQARLDATLELFQAGKCSFVFVSGAIGVEGVDESAAMKAYLITHGVPASLIIQDSEGFNTNATAKNAAVAMKQRGLKTALATSQYFHIPRLRLLLQREGVTVVGTSHAKFFEARDAYSLLREVAAVLMLI